MRTNLTLVNANLTVAPTNLTLGSTNFKCTNYLVCTKKNGLPVYDVTGRRDKRLPTAPHKITKDVERSARHDIQRFLVKRFVE